MRNLFSNEQTDLVQRNVGKFDYSVLSLQKNR